MHPIHRIVLTGGPCGGKSTALTKVTDRLVSVGFKVFQVPEIPTIMILGGATLHQASSDQWYAFQKSLLQLQMAAEDAFYAQAKAANQPAVVLCDRGCMDPSAYVPPQTWQALLDDLGTSEVTLRDSRYDAVIHLVTAAIGAESYYTTTNNSARTETVEQAQQIDHRLQTVWTGHPHLRIVDNSTPFEGKMKRVFEAVCRVTGIPEPIEIERKFLLLSIPDPLPVPAQTFDIDQTYLATTDGSEARVRRRGQSGSFTYTHTVKKPMSAGQRVEIERTISPREYVALLAQADKARRTVHKKRTCFLWKGQYFELDQFISPCKGLIILEVELDHPDRDVELPPFLKIEREVTTDKEFSNFALARSSTADRPSSQ